MYVCDNFRNLQNANIMIHINHIVDHSTHTTNIYICIVVDICIYIYIRLPCLQYLFEYVLNTRLFLSSSFSYNGYLRIGYSLLGIPG
jgi:hypothetical protein